MRILLAAILFFTVAARAQSGAATDAATEAKDYQYSSPCSDHSAACAVTDGVVAVLKHALSKPSAAAAPKISISCTDKNVKSDIPVGCPTMRVTWHNMFAGPEKIQNIRGAASEIELDSRTAKYGVEVSTIDGKWSKKFLNARAGDTIEISYKAKTE